MRFGLWMLLACVSVFAQETAVKNELVKISVPAQLSAAEDGSELTLKVGPLPETDSHVNFVGEATVTTEGWVLAVQPIEAALHAQVFNASRPDLLCKGRDERIANTEVGSLAWPEIDGYGYHLHTGERLRAVIDSDSVKDKGVVSFTFKFQTLNSGPFRRDAFPMWLDVKGCGPSAYDLKPGKNIASGGFEVSFDGQIVAMQGMLREHGEQLQVQNDTRKQEFMRARVNPVPLSIPAAGTTWEVNARDLISINASYNNPAKEEAKSAGAGVALGLFVPVDEAKLARLAKDAASSGSDPAR